MLKTANSAEPVVKEREMLHICYVLYYGDRRDPVLLILAQHRLTCTSEAKWDFGKYLKGQMGKGSRRWCGCSVSLC